jgi:nucleoside-diphosphate-sugar epimerase
LTDVIPGTDGHFGRIARDIGIVQRTVMVTGGRGFIGRAVAQRLLNSGYRVISLDTLPAESGGDSGSRVEISCDITARDQLRRVFASYDIDGIVHLAAILPTTAQLDPLRATAVNVRGSLNLLEMAHEFGARRFVFGSSLSIYGTYPADHVVSESDRAAPQDVYGAAKLYVEQFALAYCDRCNLESIRLEFVSLRIGRVIGPGTSSVTSAWRSEIFEFLSTNETKTIHLPFAASERILLVHVEDVARMLVTLLEARTYRHFIYNAVCESVVIADMKRELEGLNPKLQVRVGEGLAMGNPRLLDCSRFQREFGFEAMPIVERMQRAARGDRS